MIRANILMLDVYFDALLRLKAKSPSSKMALAEPEVAYNGLREFILQRRAVEVGDYLILYDVGTTWYSSKLHLIEELTIRFQKRHMNPVSEAVDALTFIARQEGASAIAVGDTQIGLMTPYYLAAGFSPLGTQLFKEIDYGICS